MFVQPCRTLKEVIGYGVRMKLSPNTYKLQGVLEVSLCIIASKTDYIEFCSS